MTALPLLSLSLLLIACDSSSDDTGPQDSAGSVDLDQDGYPESEDCDDRDAAVHPDTPDICNGKDDDCDEDVDEDPDVLWYPDDDGDGFGNPTDGGTPSCSPQAGAVSNGLDCNDADASTFPGAWDRCDGGDQDCDGFVDEDEAVFVDASAGSGGDGSADAPFDRIQAALDAGGQCLFVAAGTYREKVLVKGQAVRIVSVDGPESTIIDTSCGGRPLTVAYTGDGWVHVQGFRLGGGCEELGGGLYAIGSTVSLQDVDFYKNQASSAGGGIYAESSVFVFTDVSVRSNVATEVAGGALFITSSVQASNLSFTANEAGSVAGGMYVYNEVDMEATGITFDRNAAYAVAAAYLSGGSSVTFVQADVRANAAEVAGGFYVDDRSELTLVNAVLDGNRATDYASAIDVYSATANLQNVTIAHNTGYAAVRVWTYGYLWIQDTIVASNIGYGIYSDKSLYGFGVSYSDIWGNSTGNWAGRYTSAPDSTDISADPQFVSSGASDPWDDDLHLRSGSPCENSGSRKTTDWDGSAMDMGAYGGP
ncbi:MAG: putative metal-binding motif-containing protein, partial [Deltaproteobacteria bacterium]|nr:putative metal-binding motif-containing protein [Deltaproteobacteria bacterium]